MKKAVFTAVFAALISGCAFSRPDISREDWKIRTYKDITKEDVVDAAREVIRLSDPNDIIFTTTPDGFSAVRRQLSYYVVESGLDIFVFEFTARETESGIQTRIEIQERIERANLVTLGLPVAQVGKPQTSYAYQLFYSRMDYLLGLSDRWQNCKDGGAASDKQAENLGLGAFCGRFSSDLAPPPFSRKISQ